MNSRLILITSIHCGTEVLSGSLSSPGPGPSILHNTFFQGVVCGSPNPSFLSDTVVPKTYRDPFTQVFLQLAGGEFKALEPGRL